MRNVVTVFCVLFLVVACGSGAQTLTVYHIDVENADATLFVSPAGNTLLVDSGKNGHGDRIMDVMNAAGVTDIDHFVATHYHEDHYGGIDDLIDDFGVTVTNGYDRGDKQFLPSSRTTQATYKDYNRVIGSRAQHLNRGELIDFDPAMTVRCISSGGVVIGEEPPRTGHEENDMSVSLLVQFGSFRYFVGGDIEAPTEAKIAARDLVKDVDVYQANHHGSHSSSSADFMEDLLPGVVVISNGNVANFQHPRQVTLTTYANLTPPPTVFQTNKYLGGGNDFGNVADAFIGDPETDDEDGTIVVTVDLAADEYVVSYGAASHTFAIKDRDCGQEAVVIGSLEPSPHGLDRDNENVTLRNDESDVVALAGWLLRDADGKTWDVGVLGNISAGATKTIQRRGMAMTLNNNGDAIELLNPCGSIRDAFSYASASEGQRIQTGH